MLLRIIKFQSVLPDKYKAINFLKYLIFFKIKFNVPKHNKIYIKYKLKGNFITFTKKLWGLYWIYLFISEIINNSSYCTKSNEKVYFFESCCSKSVHFFPQILKNT